MAAGNLVAVQSIRSPRQNGTEQHAGMCAIGSDMHIRVSFGCQTYGDDEGKEPLQQERIPMKAKLKHLSAIISEHDLAVRKGQTEKS
jgi:hypothetical protein